MMLHDKKTLQDELQHAELLKVFQLLKGQTLPNIAYTTDYTTTPKIMEAIGHQRALAWRSVDIETRNEIDLDEHDTRSDQPYKSFFILSQDRLHAGTNPILGGYRYFIPNASSRPEHLATGEVFKPTETFYTQFFPTTINLGRSFIIEELQNRANFREGMSVFNNLFDVLAILSIENPDMKAFDGKITNKLPKGFTEEYAIHIALTQMTILEQEGIMEAVQPYPFTNMNDLIYKGNPEKFTDFYEKNWKNIQPYLNTLVRTYYTTAQEPGEASKMITFGSGTYPNHNTGYDGIETAIMIKFKDFSKERIEKYIEPNTKDRELQRELAKDFDIYKGVTLPK